MADLDHPIDDEPLGYKRPPSWGQFQKGQSGNPKGRPKGPGKKAMQAWQDSNRLTESDQILDRIGEEQVELSRGGKKVRLKKREAIRHAQMALAMKGKQAKAWADAEAEGKDEPDQSWPHPDDILIDYAERKAWVRGPWGARDVRYFEYLEAQRDLMFLRDMIHLKTCKLSEITGIAFWEYTWRLFDDRLPLDWQIAHKADFYELSCLNTPLRTLRRKADEISRLLDKLEPQACKVRDRATYMFVNTVMKPLLAKHGYKSLAHFERVAPT